MSLRRKIQTLYNLACSWVFHPYRGQSGLKLNIGCGSNTKPGWVNIDLVSTKEIFYWDVRYRWPFDDQSAQIIFAEHVLEHLSYPSEAQFFLSESLRCLEPGGRIRLSVPDAGAYLRMYGGKGWEALASARPLIKHGRTYKDNWLGCSYRTKMEFINEVFRQGGDHKYAYDAETLIMVLQNAGFQNASQQSAGELDSPARVTESLYVEGIKPFAPQLGCHVGLEIAEDHVRHRRCS